MDTIPAVQRLRFFLVLVALAAADAQAGAPVVLFQHGDMAIRGDEVDVRQGLVQLELAPGVVASAKTGAHFTFAADADDAVELVVLSGIVNVVDTRGGRIAEMSAGKYALRLAGGLELAKAWPGGVLGEERRGFLLSDVAWVRQNDVLKIPTQPLVQGFFGAITPLARSLFGRPAPQH
ncbi:MAG TPA: hypothetical protein VFJ95_12215 [Gammaproteobacteria bacterium]|nr:hypothetical protein [Gammaproteobacteria bacterium]